MSTLLEIREQLKEDLDLNEEYWKSDSDLDKLINRAIRSAHRKVLSIHEDYFLQFKQVSINANDNYIDYPSNIFANKIKSIHFYDGVNSTNIPRVNKFDSTILLDNHITTDTFFRRWLPIDDEDLGRIIRLYPSVGRAGTITVWYIREPRKLVDDDDVCDIDEFEDYVLQLTKMYYYQEDSDPRYAIEKEEAMRLEKDLIDTLTNMTIGNDDVLVQDLTHYEESI